MIFGGNLIHNFNRFSCNKSRQSCKHVFFQVADGPNSSLTTILLALLWWRMKVWDLIGGTAVIGLLCLPCKPILFLVAIFVFDFPLDVLRVAFISIEPLKGPFGLDPESGLASWRSLSEGKVNIRSFDSWIVWFRFSFLLFYATLLPDYTRIVAFDLPWIG